MSAARAAYMRSAAAAEQRPSTAEPRPSTTAAGYGGRRSIERPAPVERRPSTAATPRGEESAAERMARARSMFGPARGSLATTSGASAPRSSVPARSNTRAPAPAPAPAPVPAFASRALSGVAERGSERVSGFRPLSSADEQTLMSHLTPRGAAEVKAFTAAGRRSQQQLLAAHGASNVAAAQQPSPRGKFPAKSTRPDKNSIYGAPGALRVFEMDEPEIMPSLTEDRYSQAAEDRYSQGAGAPPPPLARKRSSVIDAEEMQAVAETRASYAGRLEQLQNAADKAAAAAAAPPPAGASVAVRMSHERMSHRASEQCAQRLSDLEAEISTAVAETTRKFAEKRNQIINEERAREQRLLDATDPVGARRRSSGYVGQQVIDTNSVWG